MFVESKDNGVTFEGAKQFEDADEYSYPKIGTFGDYQYMVWNARNTNQ